MKTLQPLQGILHAWFLTVQQEEHTMRSKMFDCHSYMYQFMTIWHVKNAKDCLEKHNPDVLSFSALYSKLAADCFSFHTTIWCSDEVHQVAI